MSSIKNISYLAPNQLVLMSNGLFKECKDLIIGDLLMSTESDPISITNVEKCNQEMYKIIPLRGDPYIISENHIISVRMTANPRIENRIKDNSYLVIWFEKDKSKSKSFNYNHKDKNIVYNEALNYKNTIISRNIVYDLTLNEYLTKNSNIKHLYKGYRLNGIDFPEDKVDLDPYILGCWLGDGT